MKYAVLVLVSLICVGCTWFIDSSQVEFCHQEHFESKGQAITWVADNITYYSDIGQYGVNDYWATPEQTYTSRKGDCEDMVILTMYFLHEMGVESYLVLVSQHAILMIDGVYYDLTLGGCTLYWVYPIGTYDYDTAMQWAINHRPY